MPFVEHVPHNQWSLLGVWGAPARFNGPVRYIVIHHSVTNPAGIPAIEQVRTIDGVIAGRGGFSMFAYSFAVPTAGPRVYTGRGFDWQNGANRDTKRTGIGNYNSVSYVLPGNYQTDQPTPLQLELIAGSIADGVAAGHIHPDFVVVPHRHVHATACPGNNVVPHISAIQTRARALTTATPPSTGATVMNGTPFTDIPNGAYYADAAKWAYDEKITLGTSNTTFGGDIETTRGVVTTFLHRLWTKVIKPRLDASEARIDTATEVASGASSAATNNAAEIRDLKLKLAGAIDQADILARELSTAATGLDELRQAVTTLHAALAATASENPPTAGQMVTITVPVAGLEQLLAGNAGFVNAEARIA